MINSKNISIDYVLNRKKNIMNILFNDINYKSTKIKYETPFVHKIKIIKTDKIKQLNFSRNVNNLKIKENNCVDTSDMNNIIIKDLQDIPISVILPDKNNLTDINGNEIHRQDAMSDEIQRIKNDPDGYGKIWRVFNTKIKPSRWIVWPHSISQGWVERITGNLP